MGTHPGDAQQEPFLPRRTDGKYDSLGSGKAGAKQGQGRCEWVVTFHAGSRIHPLANPVDGPPSKTEASNAGQS